MLTLLGTAGPVLFSPSVDVIFLGVNRVIMFSTRTGVNG